MKHWGTRAAIVLVVVLALTAVVGQATTTSSNGRYKLGETVLFKVEDNQVGWWGWWGCGSCGSCDPCCSSCNCCGPTQVTGWYVASSSGQTVYSVAFDAAVAASTWQGTWGQVDMNGVAVAAGTYTLYVKTTVGTLSRTLTLYDPCCGSCGWSWWWGCSSCNQQASITTNCYCKTSLVLLEEPSSCCGSLFWWPCSTCSSCTSPCCP